MENKEYFDAVETKIIYDILKIKADLKASKEEIRQRALAGTIGKHEIEHCKNSIQKARTIIEKLTKIPFVGFYKKHNYFTPPKNLSNQFMN